MSLIDTTYFTKFKPHLDRVKLDADVFIDLPPYPVDDDDYDACQKAADHISRQLLKIPESGRLDYWTAPEFEKKRPLEIELEILRNQRRDKWAEKSPYGELCYIHGLRAMKLMFPETDITPSLADVTYLSMGMFQHRRKYLNLLGSMDAGKSSSTARLAWLYAAIDADNFFAVTATPTVKSAQSTIFGDMTELYEELCVSQRDKKRNGVTGKEVPWVFPKSRIKSDNQIELFDKALNGKSGWMMHRSLKTGGIGIGVKGKGKDTRYGVGLYIADEVNRIENFSNFKKDLPNASKQAYFQLHTTQNPLDEMDEGGMMCEPKPWGEWGASSFREVRDSDMFIWPTVHSGIAYRFDGLKSVNIKLGKTVYPYLFDVHKHMQTMEDYGKDSPEYMSQVRAMFAGQDVQTTLLSRSKLNASKYKEDDYTIVGLKGRVMGVDPAHSGLKDKAVITTGVWADVVIKHVDGHEQASELLIAKECISVKNIQGMTWTEHTSDWLPRYQAVGGDINSLTIGAPVTYEQQIAIKMAEIAEEQGIPKNNIFYDFSLRADMVSAVAQVFGNGPVAIPLISKPVGFNLIDTKQNTEDRCKNVNEEALFLAADVVAGKALRNGGVVDIAMTQLCRRHLLTDKVGCPPEKKKDFKERNGGRSPDFGDSFAYMVWGAYSRGFRADSPVSMKTLGQSLFRKQKEIRKKITPRFKTF